MDKMNKDPKCSTEGKQFTCEDSRIGMTSNFSTVTLKVKKQTKMWFYSVAASMCALHTEGTGFPPQWSHGPQSMAMPA